MDEKEDKEKHFDKKASESIKQKENKMILYYYIATYILAIIAVLGFVFSIMASKEMSQTLISVQESSREVSNTLFGMERLIKTMQDQFILVTKPVIKCVDLRLRSANEYKKMSCDNLPISIYVTYQNTSSVTIQVTDVKLDMFYGIFEIKEEKYETVGTKQIILSPYQTYYIERNDEISFKKFLGKPKDKKATPHMRFVLTICYSSIGQQYKFMYRTEYELLYNCKHAEDWESILKNETDNPVNFIKLNY